MSFYDDLNKFVHNYPYTNYHEVVLDFLTKLTNELKKIVEDADLEHLPERLEAIEAQLDRDAEKISALESFSATASEAIQSLRAITTAHTADLEAIHNEIDGVIDQLTTAVAELEDDMEALSSRVDNLDTSTNQRLTQLESAAFDNLELSPIPFTFLIDVRNGNSKGIRIVVDEAIGANDSIIWSENKGGQTNTNLPEKQRLNPTFALPMFKNSGNPCHLVIPSIIPYKYNGSIDYTLYFYAQRWIGNTSSSNVGISYVTAVSMNSLLAVGGVQQASATQTNMCFQDMELVVNPSTGDYDLHLYNGRNGRYCAIADFTPTSIMVSTVDITGTGATQKYYNLKHTAYNQIAGALNPDGKIASALAEAKSYSDTKVSEAITALNYRMDTTEDFIYRDMTPLAESFIVGENVTLVRNKCYKSSSQWDSSANVYDTSIYYVELTVDIANMPHNTDVTIGYFSGMSISSNHNINCDMQKPNTGCYASVGTDGSITIHAYNPSGSDFGASTRVHLMGVFIEQTIT